MTFNGPLQRSTASLVFQCHVRTERLRDFAGSILDLWAEQGFPAIQSAIIGPLNLEEPIGPADILPHLAAGLNDRTRNNRSVEFSASDHVNGGITLHGDEPDHAYCSISIRLVTMAVKDADAAKAFQSRCVSFCTSVMQQFSVYSADLGPVGDGFGCIPEPPLVNGCSHLVVTSAEEISAYYDDPAGFLAADWDQAAEGNGRILLTRAMDVVDGPAYLARIIDAQWAMARAAKAGETGYEDPEVLPEEETVFRAGPARLEWAGTSAEEKQIEYRCVLGEGQHIQGWEIYALRQIVNEKKTPDGKASVETVRIVFPQEWMAQGEKRPLLDIGCRLFYQDGAGRLRDLAD